ncbi:polysaccharide biosynthesis protein [Arthrobacter sp. TMN-37]
MLKKQANAIAVRLSGFAVSLAFSTAVSLLSIPVLIRNLGGAAWADLAFSQAAAAIFGIAVAFGWGTVGSAITASTPKSERPRLFADSLVSRGYLFIGAAPLLFVSILLLSRSSSPAMAVAGIAYLLPFLGAAWFYIGEARPQRLFVLDVLPQGTGVIVGTMATFFFPTAWTFVLSILGFNALAVLAGYLCIVVRDGDGEVRLNLGLKDALKRLGGQRHGVIAAAAGSINSNGPLIAVTIIVPSLQEPYALMDRLFRYAIAGFGPVLQVIQGWIPEGGKDLQDGRIKLVGSLAPLLGVAGGCVLAAVAPWAALVLSRNSISVEYALTIPFGVIFAAVVVAQIIGLACLIPINKGAELARSSVAGACATIPLIVLFGPLYGITAIAWSVAFAELIVAGYQVLVLARYFRKASAGVPGEDERSL